MPTVALTVEQLWQPVPGGSGTYIRELVAALDGSVDLVGISARHRGGPPGDPLGVPVAASLLPRPLLYDAWTRLRLPRPPVGARRADVVHATTWAIPGGHAPLVVTVHDLAFLRFPGFFTARGNAFFRRAWDIVRREARVVMVPSRTTGDDAVAAGLDESRLTVAPHGVCAAAVALDEVDAFRRRRGLSRPYVLWVGTLEPRKNLATLLAAFAGVARASDDLDLVVAGPDGWGDSGLDAGLAAVPPERVHLLGRLSGEELHVAYSGARAFAFPSTWEGFGMPALEAMAHGVPVVSASGTAMDEFATGAALLVGPKDVPGWTEALLHAAGAGHDELAAAALARARDYTWTASAQRHLTAYERAASDG